MTSQKILAGLVFAALLAGCADKPAAVLQVPEATEQPSLEGWVLDAANAPIEGATLAVQGTNSSATSGPDGHYDFAELPIDAPLLIVAEAGGYVPTSKGVTLKPESSLLLNFTLVPVAKKIGRVELLERAVILGCQANAVTEADEHPVDCGEAAGANNVPSIDFAVGPDTVGVIVELRWTPSSPAADQLKATLETTGYGDQDEVLDETAGRSILKLQINSLQSLRFYSQGGHASLTVGAGGNPDEDESQVAASVAIQQRVDVLVSVFYVDPPSTSYTAIK